MLAEFKPDIVLVLYGAWDVYDASFDGGETWVSAGMPEFDRFYQRAGRGRRPAARRTRCPRALGDAAVLRGEPGSASDPDAVWYDPARVEVLARIEHEVAADNGMAITDIAHEAGCPVDFESRPDGVHYSDAGADEATRDWLR